MAGLLIHGLVLLHLAAPGATASESPAARPPSPSDPVTQPYSPARPVPVTQPPSPAQVTEFPQPSQSTPTLGPTRPASASATPRLLLPSRTPPPIVVPGTQAPTPSVEPIGPGGGAVAPPGPGSGSGAGGGAADASATPSGSAGAVLPAPQPGLPATPFGPGGAPGVVPGEGTVPGRGRGGTRTPTAGTPTAEASQDRGGSFDETGPHGLLGDPVTDGNIGRMWARTGSPQTGVGLLARITENRPGIWGWWPWYILILAAFAAALVRVCLAIWQAED